MEILNSADWRSKAKSHSDKVLPWIEEFRFRRSRGQAHPVADFLFTYYSFRPGQLIRWSPGIGFSLEGADSKVQSGNYWERDQDLSSLNLSLIGSKQKRTAFWICELMRSIASRSGIYKCYGLHEWAMVYRLPTSDLRHSQFPLRLSPEKINDFIDQQRICCSHYDAVRFFSPLARPKNINSPTFSSRIDHEQPGCLHTNMDLYKWAYKMSPWIPSEIISDAFILAAKIRDLDMRASPYDLTSLGCDPVPIETDEGRNEYQRIQRIFSKEAEPIRERLLEAVQRVISNFDKKER
ncbi:MAG: 3-methyladenine DNA glycosylase [Verrucomicrobiota bacterium]|nr:3-methyladenine DNA glycosylase [Verrucomicrobiota bacterium]